MIEPASIAEMVEAYVGRELVDAARYTNRAPLDESGVYSLHCLAGEIYAVGVRDGEAAAYARNRGCRERTRREEP